MGSVGDGGSRILGTVRCFPPPSARWALRARANRSLRLAMAMPRSTVADALSNLGGFDAWWEEQRQGAAQRPPDFAFEYLPPTQLSLTAQAAQSDPVRCGPLQFASTAPPPLVEYPDPPPAQLRAAAAVVPAAVPSQPAHAPEPPQPAARQLQGASADPHTGPRIPKPPPPARPTLPVTQPTKAPPTPPPAAPAVVKPRGKPSEDDKVDQDRDAFDREAFDAAMMERAERARARDGPPADLTEARLRGVRECLYVKYEGQRWQPFFKAQLRRLRRLEEEYKALHPRGLEHTPPPGDLRPSAARIARQQLRRELAELARDVLPADWVPSGAFLPAPPASAAAPAPLSSRCPNAPPAKPLTAAASKALEHDPDRWEAPPPRAPPPTRTARAEWGPVPHSAPPPSALPPARPPPAKPPPSRPAAAKRAAAPAAAPLPPRSPGPPGVGIRDGGGRGGAWAF